ncbi:hypothetical protein ALC57_18506 [Trachymyrmex cornetzi]|uniref:Endonuclease/exonuclease/phosphatase domain-containing protein n=1 Tax=Trachymyrmex cornetzi TaxID=471704 RepID=A0A151IRV1_9HYME|nr:hypothetical protein ALC57_18506 [Trachymyrmex cornetzi]
MDNRYKGSREAHRSGSFRKDRSKKKIPTKNRHTAEKVELSDKNISSSAKKLKTDRETSAPENPNIGYRILNFLTVPKYLLLSVSMPNNKPFLFALLYRPPKLGHFSTFQVDFERLLPSFSMAVIMGDLNVDLNRMTYDTGALLDFCTGNRLFSVPYNSTHHTSFSHS